MKLTIKPEFINSIITKRVEGLGPVTFNAKTCDPKWYRIYKNYGFDVFNEEPTIFKYKAIEQNKPKRKRKRKDNGKEND
jgi:hypothetical protein